MATAGGEEKADTGTPELYGQGASVRPYRAHVEAMGVRVWGCVIGEIRGYAGEEKVCTQT
jgi:hypothetical protein